MDVIHAQNLVAFELLKAQEKFPAMNSAHEGYAVILEELDELWEEIKGHDPHRDKKMEEECVQVAAMALRFLRDLC